jgi:ABC-type polysaccharide/polyol phosphate transport system ATPase subunit
MSDIAIRVEGLGKQYRIGGPQARYRTIRESVVEAAKAPFLRLSSALRGEGSRANGDTIWALKDVSFEVERGEVVGIIGRNGAGKSTLLKVLSRITEPTEGWAEIHGRVGSLLEVGTGFHPELTGRENIYLSGAVLGRRREEMDRRFDEIVDFSGVEQFLDTPLKHYSSGMQVRLGFAVAAHLEPEILLVDEVLAVGDAGFQRKCLGKMGEVAQGGRTVLFVSHNMGMVRRLCGRTILLSAGRKQAIGVTANVVDRYLAEHDKDSSPFVYLPAAKPDALGCATLLWFRDRDGVPKARFLMRERWQIVLEFEVFAGMRHVIAAVGVHIAGSIPVVTYWSKPADLAPGNYRVVFDCDFPLTSTTLGFSVGLSSSETAVYYVSDVGSVWIEPVALSEQPYRGGGRAVLFGEQESMIEAT